MLSRLNPRFPIATSTTLPRPEAICRFSTLYTTLQHPSPTNNSPFREPSVLRQPQHREVSSRQLTMEKIYSSAAAPAAGPYSQAIKAGGTIYVSGQIPADAEGTLIQDSITASTRQCCTNIQKILEEAGSGIGKVVRCGVYLTDMEYFQEMNAEYEKWFGHKPARSCIAVKQLPKGVKVEIDCIALA